MAIKHRKLFPEENTTNQTQDCYGFCDPACPYNCYFFTPPPPSSISHPNQVNHISSYLIILVTLFGVVFVVVGFYVIKVKCYAAWCGWRYSGSNPSDATTEEFLNENQVDHPVWLIATVGLQQSIINSITVCKYKKDEGLVEGTECSVCLNEFQEEETLRLLPKCNHAFHIPCIDTWLRSHTNCPLCRAGIVSNSVTSEVALSNLASTEPQNANLARNQETLIENSRNEGGLGSNMVSGESSEALELIDESNSKERVNDPTLNFKNQIEMGSVSTYPIVKDPTSTNDMIKVLYINEEQHSNEVDFGVKLVTNSNSKLGSVSTCPLLGVNSCSTESESHHTHDDKKLHTVNLRKQEQDMRRSSIEECLHMSPVSMKRSFSRYVSLNSKLNSSLLELSIY